MSKVKKKAESNTSANQKLNVILDKIETIEEYEGIKPSSTAGKIIALVRKNCI